MMSCIREQSRVLSRWLVGCLVLVLVATAGKPEKQPPCEPDVPSAVLDCLGQALNEGDLKALGRLLADDFVLEYRETGDDATPDPIGKKTYLKMMKQFVESDRIHGSSFSFLFEGEAAKEDPEGWILAEVSYSWEVDEVATETTGDSTEDVDRKMLIEKKNVTIRIQRPEGSETGYVVSRWTEDR